MLKKYKVKIRFIEIPCTWKLAFQLSKSLFLSCKGDKLVLFPYLILLVCTVVVASTDCKTRDVSKIPGLL